MTGEEWRGVLLALAIFAAMFGFPIVTIWRDERRKRRAEAEPAAQPPRPEE
jgi:type II secretory pathway component PulL